MTNTARVESGRPSRDFSECRLLVAGAALFCASAALTVGLCAAMSDMPGMAMPGGWRMSMAWMRMPGQSWLDAAAVFLAMWTVMTVAMMLPSLLPMLRRYRAAVGDVRGVSLDAMTLRVAAGYFAVWTATGVVAYVFGIAFASLVMAWPAASRAVPLASGLLAVAVGAVQFSAMKARQLDRCRRRPCVAADSAAAWRHGFTIGWQCTRCCAGFTLLLLVLGVMDVIVMIAVTAAISAERLAPPHSRMVRIVGVLVMAAGLSSILQTAGFV